jgi:hypothetical protein
LALFSYQTLTQADYSRFLNAYVISKDWWAPQDFGKPNIERFPAQSRSWNPALKNLWVSDDSANQRILAQLAIEDQESERRGLVAWPKQIFLELVLPNAVPKLDCTFYSLGKAPNRMPEAMWLTFKPEVAKNAVWSIDKVNHDVLVSDVVRGGGRSMHAVTSRIDCRDGEKSFRITTLDAPVVALGSRSPMNFSLEPPDLSEGVHVSLFNNAWGTNYPQWAGGDWKYRFTLHI